MKDMSKDDAGTGGAAAGTRVRRKDGRGTRPSRAPAAEVSLPPELGNAVGFRLRRASAAADTIFAEVFAPLDITSGHYAVLMAIRHLPRCQPSTLSTLLNITPNNLVPRIDALVARGYVQRADSETDRRIKHLQLTGAGEEFARLLVKKHEEVRRRVEAHMGAENVASLLNLLALYSD